MFCKAKSKLTSISLIAYKHSTSIVTQSATKNYFFTYKRMNCEFIEINLIFIKISS